MNYIIQKTQRQIDREKIEAETIAKIKVPTPTGGGGTGTEAAELTELKKNISDSKELLQRIIKITNVAEKKNGLKATYRKDIKEAYKKIKAKMNWNDLDSDSEFED